MNRQRTAATRASPRACPPAAWPQPLRSTGCSAGQVSQTAIQEPAVNGTIVVGGRPGDRVAAQRLPARSADRRLCAARHRSRTAVRGRQQLARRRRQAWCRSPPTSARSPSPANADRPANGRAAWSATPDGQPSLLDVEREDARPSRPQVTLTEPISNGLTYDFTFTFEQAGSATRRGADLGGRGAAPRQANRCRRSGDGGARRSRRADASLELNLSATTATVTAWLRRYVRSTAVPSAATSLPKWVGRCPDCRHLGHRQRGRRPHRAERQLGRARGRPSSPAVPISLHRSRRHPALPHRRSANWTACSAAAWSPAR